MILLNVGKGKKQKWNDILCNALRNAHPAAKRNGKVKNRSDLSDWSHGDERSRSRANDRAKGSDLRVSVRCESVIWQQAQG